jgi:hypothetical protein
MGVVSRSCMVGFFERLVSHASEAVRIAFVTMYCSSWQGIGALPHHSGAFATSRAVSPLAPWIKNHGLVYLPYS